MASGREARVYVVVMGVVAEVLRRGTEKVGTTHVVGTGGCGGLHEPGDQTARRAGRDHEMTVDAEGVESTATRMVTEPTGPEDVDGMTGSEHTHTDPVLLRHSQQRREHDLVDPTRLDVGTGSRRQRDSCAAEHCPFLSGQSPPGWTRT